MSVICTVCARGGSRGVPGKNLRPLLGMPLVAVSVKQAKRCGFFDTVLVSSDSSAILDAAAAAGADILVKRPDELAVETAGKVPAIRHAVVVVEQQQARLFDVVVDLDATSPLRTISDIKGVLDLLAESGAGNVITGSPARRSPHFNLVQLDGRGVVRLAAPGSGTVLRRQDAPPCYDLNASIYAWRREVLDESDSVFLGDTRLYEMPRERSVDLDDELDFVLIEHLANDRPDLQHLALP